MKFSSSKQLIMLIKFYVITFMYTLKEIKDTSEKYKPKSLHRNGLSITLQI